VLRRLPLSDQIRMVLRSAARHIGGAVSRTVKS
jgi:hypothetical protein